ncbi:LtrC-like protein [Weissella jogaejeotgali]|uniref:LtrC-like protein n=1 Tax=Weissella jogaejeotgali TaxID=1631871 RepID=A0A1L6RB59_9LACO|nr:toprim domain-containing protein [Weissella jogaejeotgali]APS41784.1 LtrC-like protein [Weissella jogaejeotgali]
MTINREAMKALPIQGYLDYKGIDYTTEHNRLRLVDHDSCIINTDKNVFFWNSKQLSGDLGDFISAFEDVTPKEAWVRWSDYKNHYDNQDEQAQDKYKQKSATNNYQFDWKRWRTSQSTNNTENYLVNERGFDKTFVQRLTASEFIKQGKPRQDWQTKEWQKPAILFPWHDEKGEVVGLDQQGTEIDYEKYGKRGTQKKVAAGSDSNYGYNFHTGNGADQLLVFESPIDALSYAQQHFPELAHENATFLSLSGTDHQKVLSQLDRMNQLNGHLPNKLVLATDNDLAGFQAADQFSVLQFEGMENIRQVPPKGKDWNDQLKANDPGIKTMTMEESHKRLEALETFSKQAKQPSNKSMKVQDDKQVVNANPGRLAREQRRTDRKGKSREKNEEIIKDALQRMKNYQNDPKEAQNYLDFVAQGQNYSPRNTMLIYGQRQDATIVKGYKQFAEQDIQVNKGEQGMKIYGAPKNLQSVITPDGKQVYWRDATAEQRQQAKTGDLEIRSVKHYPIQTVFDIKQTNASLDDLPKLLPNRPVNLLTDQSDEQLQTVYDTLKEYATEQQHVKVIDQDKGAMKFLADHKPMTSNGIAKGATVINRKDPKDRSIVLRPDLPVTDRIATLAHEMGHTALHQQSDANTSTAEKELQAEMTSYVVLKNIGVEPGDLSEKYMSDWTKSLEKVADMKDRNPNLMADVTKASTSITNYLSDRLSDGQTITNERRAAPNIQPTAVQMATNQAIQDQAQEEKRERTR